MIQSAVSLSWCLSYSHFSHLSVVLALRSQGRLFRVRSTQIVNGAFGAGAVELAQDQLVQIVRVRQPFHQQAKPYVGKGKQIQTN